MWMRNIRRVSRPRNWVVLVAVLFLAAAIFDHAEAEEDANELTVISYNVQFLPAPVSFANKRKNPEYRARRIAEEASRFDVVGLNETFDERYRDIIVAELKKAWGGDLNVLLSPATPDRFNGGCLLASRYPFIETNTMIYENFSSPEDYGMMADGHAAKGVLHARIARDVDEPDDFVDVFVTHMEARAPEIREKEYPELAAFIRRHSDPSRPTLILGDMNTRGGSAYRSDPKSQYTMLMKALNSSRSNSKVTDVWPLLEGDALGGTSEQDSTERGHRIDYIFVSDPRSSTELTPLSIRVNMYQDSEVIALSDHSAVEAVFRWTRER